MQNINEKTYDEKIVSIFKELCDQNGGASPSEVTKEMGERGWLSNLDTVIDIEKLMKKLRSQGKL